MKWLTVLCLLVVCFVCLSVAQVSYDDCCLKYSKKHSRTIQKHAVRYRMQEVDGGCNLPAVIFTLKRGKVYCVDPAERWVPKLIRSLESRAKKVFTQTI
uniref:Chemokine interleukin-8-like domain-containing protein n=1 Tax=Periophthalmus magnuspinnatus TaxID=409849 RepID=A0A3B4ANJ2_9GOBI